MDFAPRCHAKAERSDEHGQKTQGFRSFAQPSTVPPCWRGVLMLTALALLLCFGLKPSRAAAPDAEDGALTASDASARLSAECELLQRVTFSPCGHEMTRRQRLPAELAGMTEERNSPANVRPSGSSRRFRPRR